MEQDDIKKLIEERMLELPQTIRDVIVKSGWTNTIRSLVKKHNLRIDQGSNLETETLLIMLGIETQEQYIKNLINEAQLSPELAGEIAQEVNLQIFSLIKNKLIENTEEKDESAGIKEIKKVISDSSVNKYKEPDTKKSLERDSLLKEIEDKDETAELMIPVAPQTPSTQVNTSEQNQKIISQDLSTTNQNTVAQKLQTPTVSAPTTMKIDPYLELPE